MKTYRVHTLFRCWSFFLIAFYYLCPVSIQAETLFAYQRGQFKIDLKSDSIHKHDGVRLNINSKALSDATIFDLDNPLRIVIDLAKQDKKIDKQFAIKDLPFISQVRIGSHPDKLRIVLDIASDTLPAYRWEKKVAGVTLFIGKQQLANTEASLPAPEMLEELPTNEEDISVEQPVSLAKVRILDIKASNVAPLMESQPIPETETVPNPQEPAPEAIKAPIKESIPEELQVKEADQQPMTPEVIPPELKQEPQLAASQQLLGIVFEYRKPENTPVIKLPLNQHAKFTLIKKGKDQYVLTIPNCMIAGKHLTLPYFPPHDFIGFTLLHAQQDGEDALITINVDEGTNISSFTKGHDIYLRSLAANNQ